MVVNISVVVFVVVFTYSYCILLLSIVIVVVVVACLAFDCSLRLKSNACHYECLTAVQRVQLSQKVNQKQIAATTKQRLCIATIHFIVHSLLFNTL